MEQYNVLKSHVDSIKKLKKKCSTIDEFSEKLRNEMMYYYWSKAEHEVILEREDNQLYIKPWVGSRNPEEAMIIATEDDTLDWVAFSRWDKLNWWGDEAKIDIYDQLRFRWDEFVNYCWTYRHKWERVRKDVV